MLKNGILIFQIILAAVLVFLIILQSKGTGLSSSIMGGLSLYSTKRGVEKVIFYLTIAVSFLFFLTSIGLLAIK